MVRLKPISFICCFASLLVLSATGCDQTPVAVPGPTTATPAEPAHHDVVSDDSTVYNIEGLLDVSSLSDEGPVAQTGFQCPRTLSEIPPLQPIRFVYPQPGGSNWAVERFSVAIPGSDGSINLMGARVPTRLYRVFNPTIAYSTDYQWVVSGDFTVRAACHMVYTRTFISPNRVLDIWDGFYIIYQVSGNVYRNQVACSGGGGGVVTETDYSPYDDGSEPAPTGGGGCGGTGSSSGNQGSGTQFHPGEFTNGETVDWATGVGNGGSSACGVDAEVEYICIDIWVEDEGWVEWSCGYATTC